MKKIKFSFSKLFETKKATAVTAFLLACVLWFIITSVEKPIQILKISNVPIEINLEGTAASEIGLALVGADDFNEKATVSVSGSRSVVNALKSSDIIVSADLSQVTKAGEYTLKLETKKSNDNNSYEIKEITPSTVTVSFDYSDTKEFKIEPKVIGATAPEGLIVDTPTFSNNSLSTVVVKGPRSAMDKLNSVCAYVEVNAELPSTKAFDAELRLLDINGNQLDKSLYTFTQNNIQLTVPICKKVELPVFVKFADTPVNDTPVLSYKLSQDTVTVIGSPENIDAMSSVSLAPISLQTVSTSTKSLDTAFALPDGVRVLDNIEKITVTFNMSSYTEKTLNVAKENIIFTNLEKGLTATATSSIKNVKLCGTNASMRAVNNENTFAVADLQGKSAGEYTVNVTVYSDKATGIWQVGTYTTTVTVQ